MSRLPLASAPAGRANPADLFMQAVMHYRQGDDAGARRQLKLVLRKQPQHFDALHLMSLLEAQRGHYKDAEKMLRQALLLNPNSAEAQSNRGNMLRELGQLDDAVKCYDAALALNPKYHNAHNNRAIALTKLGRFDEALQSYGSAIMLEPRFAAAYYNRGMALAHLRRFDEAVADYDKALSLEPGMVTAHIDRANALVELGKLDDALAAYGRILAVDPRSVAAHYNLGLAMLRSDRFDEAISHFGKALEIDPTFSATHDAQGNALLGLGRIEEALASYDKALAATPNSAPAHNNRGMALQKLHRPADALASFDAALRVNPEFAAAHGNRAQALLALGKSHEAQQSFNHAIRLDPASIDLRANRGNAAMTARQYETAAEDFAFVLKANLNYPYAAGSHMHCKMQVCDWSGFDRTMATIETAGHAGERVALPFIMTTLTNDARLHLQAAKIWAADMGFDRPAPPATPLVAHDKIRVAYLSADFREHPVATQTAQLFELHDQSRFEISAISYGPNDRSEIRTRLERGFDDFCDVSGKNADDIASLMRSKQIDVAVDLTGYTDNCRPEILALRPAPIQVNFLGYPATMGVDHIDYLIADRHVAPFDQQPLVSERIVHLPDTFFVSDTTRAIAEPPSRASAGLPDNGLVFCCFNNRYKITPAIFNAWMRLLQAIDGSVLWLAGGSSVSGENLRREAQARGVAPERLVFANRVPGLADHLARHRLADLFLDTLPYNAHSTATDALWAGLPLVTCVGSAFPGRVASSLLSAIDLPELITTTLSDYENLALNLARNPQKLAGIKSKLAVNRDSLPLFNSKRFCRHLEAAYEIMMQRHQRGEKPESFVVSPIA